MFPRPTLVLAALALLSVPFLSPAQAHSVRSLGMGGALAPSGAASVNPAYAGLPDTGSEFGLPLGLANLIVDDRLRPGAERFDPFALFDQLTSVETLLFNPARSPEELVTRIAFDEDGEPIVAVRPDGGSTFAPARGRAASFRSDTTLPLAFETGTAGLRVGVRPYLSARGSVRPDRAFRDVVREGAPEGRIDFGAAAQAGVALDVQFGGPLPLPTDLFPGTLHVGVRGAPFLGLARADLDGSAIVSVGPGQDGDLEARWTYDADAFVAVVGDGGIGYGLVVDVGATAVVPTPEGTVTAGLSVHDLAFESWSGYELRFIGSDEAAVRGEGRRPASRTAFGAGIGVTGTFAYDLEPATIGVPELASLLLVADASYRPGGVQAHLGAEAGVGVPFGTVLGRAGLGYENGLVVGVGGGLRFAGAGFDVAVHGRRSPLAEHTAFGVAAGLAFGF